MLTFLVVLLYKDYISMNVSHSIDQHREETIKELFNSCLQLFVCDITELPILEKARLNVMPVT